MREGDSGRGLFGAQYSFQKERVPSAEPAHESHITIHREQKTGMAEGSLFHITGPKYRGRHADDLPEYVGKVGGRDKAHGFSRS